MRGRSVAFGDFTPYYFRDRAEALGVTVSEYTDLLHRAARARRRKDEGGQ